MLLIEMDCPLPTTVMDPTVDVTVQPENVSDGDCSDVEDVEKVRALPTIWA